MHSYTWPRKLLHRPHILDFNVCRKVFFFFFLRLFVIMQHRPHRVGHSPSTGLKHIHTGFDPADHPGCSAIYTHITNNFSQYIQRWRNKGTTCITEGHCTQAQRHTRSSIKAPPGGDNAAVVTRPSGWRAEEEHPPFFLSPPPCPWPKWHQVKATLSHPEGANPDTTMK